nr:TlpA disulfide reductase family protein [uncultured Bacteroides sp.]
MRKLFLLLLSATFVANATAQVGKRKTATENKKKVAVTEKGYTISGSITGATEGDTIYLADMNYFSFIPTDSTVVKNGAFSFKGHQKNPTIKFILCIKNKDLAASTDFILENTDIKINLARGETKRRDVVGGRDNDLWNKFSVLEKNITSKMEPYWKTSQDSTLSDSVRTAAKNELDKIEKEQTAFHAKYIRENLPSGVSDILLGFYAQKFDKSTFEEILADMKRLCPKDPVYLEYAHQIEIERTTAIGCQYTDIALNDPDGKAIRISDFINKNKVTLIDFWASWCGPCRAEMPNVVKAYSSYKNKGFGIIGISLDNNGESWKKAIETLQISWPQMSDLKGWSSKGAAAYNITSIPATILINQKGEIIAKNLRGEDLEKKLAELLQ